MSTIPRITLTQRDPEADEKLKAFAAEHIGDAEEVVVDVVYEGFEGAADRLTINREGVVVAAVEAPDA